MGAASAGAEELSAASVTDNENVWPIVREPEPCTFENRETEMTLNLTNLHYKDLLHFDLKGSACWKNGVFSIDIKDSYLNDEPFFMRGMIDLYEEQGYSYDFDLRINQLNLQSFISLTLADQDGNEDKDKEKSGGI